MEGVLDVVNALVLLASTTAIAYPLGALLAGEARTSWRWAASVVVALWTLITVFQVLALLGAFRLFIAAPLLAALAALVIFFVARPRRHLELLRGDIDLLLGLAARLIRIPLGAVVGLTAVLLSIRTLRGLVAPPLGWDSLTYHLLKAGRWVQSGTWVSEAAPDAWSYYEYFPPGGDALWAWAMLPTSSDALLAPAGLMVWGACLLAGYAAATLVGATRRRALATALVIATLPCVLNYLTTGYVNSVVLALALLALAATARVLDSGRTGDAVLAGAAVGVGAAVQHGFLPLAGLLGLVVVWGLWRHRRARGGPALGAVVVVAAAVAAPCYLRAWMETGSPFYPLTVTLGDHVVFPGNEQLRQLFSGESLPPELSSSSLELIARLFWRPFAPGLEHLNFGPASSLLLLLGPVGAFVLCRRPGRRAVALLLLLAAAFTVLPLLSDSLRAHTAYFNRFLARFIVLAAASLAILAAAVPGKVTSATRILVVLGGLAYSIPRGFSAPDWEAMGKMMWYLGPALALAALLIVLGRRRGHGSWGVAAGVGVVLIGLGLGQPDVRAFARYRVYAQAVRRDKPAFDGHPIDHANAWPLWRALDRPQPLTIAYSAGWDGIGHNWFRYPLLGSRLQNRVLFVPVTRDGAIRTRRWPRALWAVGDRRAWLRRLAAARVQVVAVAGPNPAIELVWMSQLRRVFRPIARGRDRNTVACAVSPEELARAIARP